MWSSLLACIGELGCVAVVMIWVDSWFVAALELGCVAAVRLWVDSWFMAALLCLVTLIGCSCTSGATTLLDPLVPFVEISPH